MEARGVRAVVASGGRRSDYPVYVRRGLLAEMPALVARHAPAHRYAIIADDHVASLYGEGLAKRLAGSVGPTTLLTFPAGEESKNRDTWSSLTDQLLDGGFGRDTTILALGGGVSGDLGGFVASTFLRGVPLVQVPTSVLAMVDASVGGKTGVDVPQGKNLVGAFHPPRMVVADPDVLATLPRGERALGLAEAVKHGAIVDAHYLDRIEATADLLLGGDADANEPILARSVEIKADVVSNDEHEGGWRQILNFGHTYGHALEAASDYRLPHGAAVAIGMVMEAALGERMGRTQQGTARRLGEVLSRLGLPTRAPSELDRDVVMQLLSADKKARKGVARFVLLERCGRIARAPDDQVTWQPPAELVSDLVDELRGAGDP